MRLGIGSRVIHREYGEGIIAGTRDDDYKVSFFGKGIVIVPQTYPFEVLENVEDPHMYIHKDDLEDRLETILRKWSDVNEVVLIGDKWRGGSLLLQPKDGSLKPKEVPIETFFHKIVMLRDRLRVLEQKINAHGKLADDEKVEMQQYITRIYGTLTTFNVLFRYSQDYFTGEKS
ncbi:MAG TPA: hypothetical protein VL947_08585 [Cytophagales bacterium]|nr:hypothetical protein [Cytophagales bacterium]